MLEGAEDLGAELGVEGFAGDEGEQLVSQRHRVQRVGQAELQHCGGHRDGAARQPWGGRGGRGSRGPKSAPVMPKAPPKRPRISPSSPHVYRSRPPRRSAARTAPTHAAPPPPRSEPKPGPAPHPAPGPPSPREKKTRAGAKNPRENEGGGVTSPNKERGAWPCRF